jgi:hypothetical protein
VKKERGICNGMDKIRKEQRGRTQKSEVLILYMNNKGSKVRTYAPKEHESKEEATSLQRERE